MRSIALVALLVMLILAGCTGQPEPTPTAVPPTAVPPTGTTVLLGENPLGTLAATIGAAQPGTLVIPNDQNTPNAPTAVPIVIDDLVFTQTGGIAAISITIELHGDGTLVRDGKTSKVAQSDVSNIASMLDAIHFFSLQGIFVSPSGAAADAYSYSLTVNTSRASRTISSQDGMTPPELAQIYDAVRALDGTA